ncbi:helix-turn-helix transcriptional regulator [Acetanaerobacterium elongatum]|uniref:Regulatory protein, luxR family n=1 Tax=Acetanaerobacterium elongatum TaxID=258515 RepID=A0A1G9TXA7_9FIRM|nr:helix-turn-helix transcriptional regulator [Acetanaerobacterium elongatum]SDM52390.1 regulatory protein, luxR family [Acetanaerobacterium elongatum]
MGLLKQLRNTLSPASELPAEQQETAGKGKNVKTLPNSAERRSRFATLTKRERETCLLLLEGYTMKDSAEMLGIKYSTVNTHMTELYKKLGVGSRAELIIRYKDIAAKSKVK